MFKAIALTALALILSACSGLYVEAGYTREDKDFWQQRREDGMRGIEVNF